MSKKTMRYVWWGLGIAAVAGLGYWAWTSLNPGGLAGTLTPGAGTGTGTIGQSGATPGTSSTYQASSALQVASSSINPTLDQMAADIGITPPY
jgi:hypothetical protein